MANVIFGSARIDENGNAHGGAAGDQNGKEVSTQAWYKHSKGWRVFRAKDPAKRKLIAEAMRRACSNNNIGYDQYQRLTLYNAVKDLGFDPGKATGKVETDCSALVRVCCAFAGITLPNFVTAGQAEVMLDSGAFMEMTGTKYTDQPDYLEEGDVLVTKSRGHTVVALTSGDKADVAPAEPDGDLTVAPGTWNVRTGPGTGWPSVGVVKGGEKLQSVDPGEWIPVLIDGAIRWVSPKAVGR